MESLTTHQRAALQIARADGKIATAEQLAEFRMAKKEDGSPLWPRYMDGSDKERLSWLGDQFFGLAVLSHITLSSATVTVDTVALNTEIMDEPALRELTLPEIQEAFRKGVNREYGDYYGLTSISLLGFLRGFLASEKKVRASNIIFRMQRQSEMDADARFFRELRNAGDAGLLELPEMKLKSV